MARTEDGYAQYTTYHYVWEGEGVLYCIEYFCAFRLEVKVYDALFLENVSVVLHLLFLQPIIMSCSDLYDRFLAAPWPSDFSTHPRPEDAELECVIVEPRNHPRLIGVLRNMSAMFPYAALTIFCSSANLDMLKECHNTNVCILCVIPSEGFTREDYGHLLMTPDFWDQLICEKILIFQTDTGVLRNDILRFMQYDYVGAPWPWTPLDLPVGNGGLSLRSRKWMTYIARRFGALGAPAGDCSEDLFFCHRLRDCWDAKLPSPTLAAEFAIEYPVATPPLAPMGFHQFYLYHDADFVAKLLHTDPPDSTPPLSDIVDAWIETSSTRYYHPRLVKWLKTGISRTAGFAFPPETVIPFVHDIVPGEPKRLVVQYGNGSLRTYQMRCIP